MAQPLRPFEMGSTWTGSGAQNAKAGFDCFWRVACYRLDDPNGRGNHASCPQGGTRVCFRSSAATRRLWFGAFGSACGHRDQKLRCALVLPGLTPAVVLELSKVFAGILALRPSTLDARGAVVDQSEYRKQILWL
jgi:hypothetical protein